MIIKQEKFVEILNFMREQSIKQNKLCSVLEEMSSDTYCDCFIYSEYENKMLDLLENMFDDTDEDIEYFLYELGWMFDESDNRSTLSQKDKFLKNEKGEILYNSLETLYDYLVLKMK